MIITEYGGFSKYRGFNFYFNLLFPTVGAFGRDFEVVGDVFSTTTWVTFEKGNRDEFCSKVWCREKKLKVCFPSLFWRVIVQGKGGLVVLEGRVILEFVYILLNGNLQYRAFKIFVVFMRVLMVWLGSYDWHCM